MMGWVAEVVLGVASLFVAGYLVHREKRNGGDGEQSGRDIDLSAIPDLIGPSENPQQDAIVDTFLPRGIRNNNPLNIREAADGGDQWRGEAAGDQDSAFEEFIAPEYGYRAAAKVVFSYRRRGLGTLADIVGAWAPTNENNTGAYVRSVANATGFQPGRYIHDADLPVLFQAMAIHENGADWAGHPALSLATIRKGVAMA